MLDLTAERFPTIRHEPLEALKARLLTVLESDETDGRSAESELNAVNNSVRDTWTDMRFFTAGKFMGFGPFDMQPGDVVSVLLGLSTPLIIRPAKGGAYTVVGWAYVHGLMDGEALLGPLLPTWRSKQYWTNRRFLVRYQNIETSRIQRSDPRLQPLPSDWRRVYADVTQDDSVVVAHYRNRGTGEVINYDPRMTRHALLRRGVQLDYVRLV